jgi:hypothetical protein
MKLYASAIALAFALTVALINACMLHESAKRTVPVNIYQLK